MRQNDLDKEKDRYSCKASEELKEWRSSNQLQDGIDGIPSIHHEPYLAYYAVIQAQINSESLVLEIAAGTGRHTKPILKTGAKTTCLDISEIALEVLSLRTAGLANTVCASMELMPFPSNTFDFVVSCGGMSYVDNAKLQSEIIRVLKPGGSVILFDSLNHNPIYIINRFLRFLRKDRTFSTLYRMPRLALLNSYSSQFEVSTLSFFGKSLWVKQLLNKIGIKSELKLLTLLDGALSQKSAFKFILVGNTLRK
jgi:SAM-dependent methyltransferase